jgi:hypothetical protein
MSAHDRKGERVTGIAALIEDVGPSIRQVVGIDAGDQLPGGVDNGPGADFIRYIHQAPETGQPADLFNPVQPCIGVRVVTTTLVRDDFEGLPS